MKSFMIYTPRQILLRYQIQADEMGGACGSYGWEEKCTQGFVGKPEGQNYVADVSIGASIILKWTIKK
jgi:hypothetical protein